jgi:hypothetical protein
MVQWLKIRFEIIKLTIRNPALILFLVILLSVQLIRGLVPPSKMNARLFELLTFIPWYGWVIGWLVLFWLASIEYSVKRKEVFDQTSRAFFKAYLGSLIKQGNDLFNHSEEKDFFSKINDWRHRVIQGIAIGLGPEASQKYFHKMESKNPVQEPDKSSSLALKTSDSLCRILQENLEELNRIRTELPEAPGEEKPDLEADKNIKMIGGPKS